MNFLVDNQLPVALAQWLNSNGNDAVHILTCGLDSSCDLDIWTLAAAESRIVRGT